MDNPHMRMLRRYITSQVPDATCASWSPDETIHLSRRDGRTYTMRIGSDDEEYHFVNDADSHDVLRFPIEEQS